MINRRDIFKGLLAGVIFAGTAVPAVAKVLETQPNWNKLTKRKVILDIQKAMQDSMTGAAFEFNDDITRKTISAYVAEVARKHQLNRSLYDFLVICNETNNTPKVIDANELKCDVYLKFPNDIKFTHLNAVSKNMGVTFEEAVGLLNS